MSPSPQPTSLASPSSTSRSSRSASRPRPERASRRPSGSESRRAGDLTYLPSICICSADKGIPEHTYQFQLDLFAPIDPAATKKNLSSRYLQLILQKKEAKEEFWPRLTKEKVRLQWLKTDFSKVRSSQAAPPLPVPPRSTADWRSLLISGLTRTSRTASRSRTTASSRAAPAAHPAWAWAARPVRAAWTLPA